MEPSIVSFFLSPRRDRRKLVRQNMLRERDTLQSVEHDRQRFDPKRIDHPCARDFPRLLTDKRDELKVDDASPRSLVPPNRTVLRPRVHDGPTLDDENGVGYPVRTTSIDPHRHHELSAPHEERFGDRRHEPAAHTGSNPADRPCAQSSVYGR